MDVNLLRSLLSYLASLQELSGKRQRTYVRFRYQLIVDCSGWIAVTEHNEGLILSVVETQVNSDAHKISAHNKRSPPILP